MTAQAAPRPAVRPVPLVLVLLAFAVLVGLGVWQLQRLGWKELLIAQVAAARSAPPGPLAPALRELAAGGDVDYRHVQTSCPTVEQTRTLRLYALPGAVAGYRLITACAVDAPPYRSILVDRGFVVREEADRVRPSSSPLAVPLVGVLRHGDRPTVFTPRHASPGADWYGRDVPAMAAALGAPAPAPVFFMLESPAPRGFGPTPMPVPVEISNRHLGYVITWFGLAAALAGVYLGSLLRTRRAS